MHVHKVEIYDHKERENYEWYFLGNNCFVGNFQKSLSDAIEKHSYDYFITTKDRLNLYADKHLIGLVNYVKDKIPGFIEVSYDEDPQKCTFSGDIESLYRERIDAFKRRAFLDITKL